MDINHNESFSNSEPAIQKQTLQTLQSNVQVNLQTQISGNNTIHLGVNEKQKKQRRKKTDGGPRDWICDICQKSYLSLPALSSHKKAKHNVEPEKKSRGRPRKNVIKKNN